MYAVSALYVLYSLYVVSVCPPCMPLYKGGGLTGGNISAVVQTNDKQLSAMLWGLLAAPNHCSAVRY
jgi:hypothetical protein